MKNIGLFFKKLTTSEKSATSRQKRVKATKLLNEARNKKRAFKVKEEKSDSLKKKLDELMQQVPNVAYDEVPEGSDETGNKEVKKVGEPKNSRSHQSLTSNWLRCTIWPTLNGSKSCRLSRLFLKNQLALLHVAVLMYAFTKLASKGYVPIIAPSLVKEFTFLVLHSSHRVETKSII